MNAVIRRSGNLIHVFPALKEQLAPQLTYTKRVQEGGNAREAKYQTIELWSLVDEGLLCPAGFTCRVSSILRKLGYAIRFEDYRERRLAEPDLSLLDPLRDGQEEIIVSIVASDCGVIEAPTGSGKSFIIRQVCKIWPTANIIICSPYTDLIRQTYSELKELIQFEQIGMIGGGKSETGRRVSCVVDRSLMKCDLSKCDIFIFDEVHRAAAPKTAEALVKVRNARMFGFSASPYGRADRADLEMEGFFGQRICELSYQEVQKTGSIVPIQVCIYDTAHFDQVQADTTSALERRGVWRNAQRNILIEQVVRQLQQKIEDPQILISVKTVEHAVFLGKQLPDFKLCYGSMGADKRKRWEKWGLIQENTHPISARQREELYNDFRSGAVRRVIATGVWSTGVDFPALNVLIRADGQSGDIANTQIPGRVTRYSEGKDVGIIIDFDDAYNETLKKRAARRIKAYRRKGWSVTLASTTNYRAQ